MQIINKLSIYNIKIMLKMFQIICNMFQLINKMHIHITQFGSITCSKSLHSMLSNEIFYNFNNTIFDYLKN